MVWLAIVPSLIKSNSVCFDDGKVKPERREMEYAGMCN